MQGRHDAIAGGGEVAKNHVATLFAADVEVVGKHFFQNIPVADLRAHRLAASLAERKIKAEIAHHSRHESFLFQLAPFQPVERGNAQHIVTIHKCPGLVTKQNPVAVAVVRNADVRA